MGRSLSLPQEGSETQQDMEQLLQVQTQVTAEDPRTPGGKAKSLKWGRREDRDVKREMDGEFLQELVPGVEGVLEQEEFSLHRNSFTGGHTEAAESWKPGQART